MPLRFNFVADHVVKGKIYPALAQHQARPYTQSWREFGQHWPHTIPLRLQEYCVEHGVDINTYSINLPLPPNTYYPVGLGFFDFGIDYFELMSVAVRKKLQQEQLRVLFYYHEGDNPERIKHRLDELVQEHLLPLDCYVFVSANSAAQLIPGFVFFNDFELWYYQRNITQVPLSVHTNPRHHDFTVLNRLHKPWRATAMAHMQQAGILDNSYWSYCEHGAVTDENPIEIDSFAGLRLATHKFLEHAPYVCDQSDQNQRNDHSLTDSRYHNDSYCNIVMETHFDADQSGGAFITEKTFKPIKHGQMFFVAGAAHSLAALRDLGYKTFDHVLDNSYDAIDNNTQRWQCLSHSIASAQSRLPELFEQAMSDILHNQQLFVSSKKSRLNTLLTQINEQYH
jgi:hypothetical protein